MLSPTVYQTLTEQDFQPFLQQGIGAKAKYQLDKYNLLVFHFDVSPTTEPQMSCRKSSHPNLCPPGCACVLGSARTGLIFTRNQEGAQPGGLAQLQPGQTEQGIPYHVPSCWVPVRGVALWELSRWSEARGAGPVRESGSVLRSVLSCFLLICIVVVTVPFVCCSVKLPLSGPTSFLPVYFHSPPHRGGGRSGRVALFLPPAAEIKTAWLTEIFLSYLFLFWKYKE